MRVVDFARERGLRVAAQSTGHGAGAMAPLTDTILLRTGRLTAIEIDAAGRRARVEAGVLAADVALAAGEAGLAALLGSSPDTGVAGFTLGGGVGWLGRSHGLACNSVRAIELVTADGEQRRVDADNDPELFFALRGGGGSFGVVTALEIELYPVAEVYAGMVAWPGEMGSEIAHAYREWLARHARRDDGAAALPDASAASGAARAAARQVARRRDRRLHRRPRRGRGARCARCARSRARSGTPGEFSPAPALRQLAMDPEEPVPGRRRQRDARRADARGRRRARGAGRASARTAR